jgi:two-component system response regulator DevR
MKVFLVEDSPLLRERLEALLGAVAGTQVIGHASGAQEAVRGILDGQPDVVVLDIHLKEGNGFDVLQGIAKAPVRPDVYVLTNHPLPAYRQRAEQLGASGFFDKSGEIDRLREALAARTRR